MLIIRYGNTIFQCNAYGEFALGILVALVGRFILTTMIAVGLEATFLLMDVFNYGLQQVLLLVGLKKTFI